MIGEKLFGLHEVKLLIFKQDLITKLVLGLLKRLLVVELRDFQFFTAVIQVLANTLQQVKLVLQLLLNARLEYLQDTRRCQLVTGPLSLQKWDHDRHTRLGNRRLQRDTKRFKVAEFLSQRLADDFQWDRRSERFQLTQVLSQFERKALISSENLPDFLQHRRTLGKQTEPS